MNSPYETSPHGEEPRGGRPQRNSPPPGFQPYPNQRPAGPPPGRPAPPPGGRPVGGPPPGQQPPRRQGPPPQRPPQGAPPHGRPPQGGRPYPGPGPGRPNNPQPNSAQSTQKIEHPGERRPGSLSEAVAERERRGGTATGPRPVTERPRRMPDDGSSTGERRAQGAAGPPSGPPRRGGGSGGDGGSEGPGRRRPATGKKKSPWRYVRRTIYVFLALFILVPSTAFLIGYSTVSVPKPGDLKNDQVATIFATDGSEIGKVVPPMGNRSEVSIDQIPPHVRNAVIAAEDRDFYTNPGFSLKGFARAAWDNVTGKESAGGGSTITQQYVKNAVVGNERSLDRKWKELIISAKMARQWSKNEILAAYLNTIYFGRGAYGIDAAAKAYFGKPVQELNVAEGAVLAATIQLPSSLDPEKNPDGAHARWNYVLDGMVSGGNLDAGERKAMQYPPVVPLATVGDNAMDKGPEGLIKTQVLKELADAGISEQQLNTLGLQITTTIDPKAQRAAVDAARNKMQGEPENLRTGVVSIDPRTGSVRAYYGGEDGQGFDFANAALQTGSAFKVFGLAENLAQGKPLSELYDSGPLEVNGIKISNVEGEQCGQCTIAEALKRSLNTSFYRMQLAMAPQGSGPSKIAAMAHKLGIPETIPGFGKTLTEPDGSGPNNGIVLGQYNARVLDMASAYATLAASGVYHAPHFVQKVTTADGEVLLDRGEVAGEQRVEAAIADNVTDAMKPIAAWSRNHNLSGGRESATKTGTAQLGETGQNKDAWMVGYTPSLSTAVWVGTPDGQALKNYQGGMIYGSGLPSDIWKATMDGALQGTKNETFPKPAPIKGQAGVPKWTAPYTPPSNTPPPFLPPVIVAPTQVEILPGITIPVPGVQPAPQQPQQPQQREDDPGPMEGQPVAPSAGATPTTGARPTSGDGTGTTGTRPTHER